MADREHSNTQGRIEDDTTEHPVTVAILRLHDRMTLVNDAGNQIAGLVEAMHAPIKRMCTAETTEEEVVLSVFLDRLAQLAVIVQDLGCSEEDMEGTQDQLDYALSLALDRE